LNVLGKERVVLSHHPPAAESYGSFEGSSINICKYEWDANGLPRFSAQVVVPPQAGMPFPGVFIGAGMVFARSELLIDCPFDYHMPYLFSGEELLLAACAWSHGWDIYNPSFAPVFHFYKDSAKMIPNPTNDEVHAKSLKRLKFALGVEGSSDDLPEGEFREDFDRFAMGRFEMCLFFSLRFFILIYSFFSYSISARMLKDYYPYAGINWQLKTKSYPFCSLPRETDEYIYHNTPVDNLPRLDSLSFDSGHSMPWANVDVLSGDELVRAMSHH
jgi:hypothetical protein